MIVYVMVAIMVNTSPGKTDIGLDVVPFNKLEDCQKTAEGIKPKLEEK
jgi:hypothetical protein